jgi:hypothetical protein
LRRTEIAGLSAPIASCDEISKIISRLVATAKASRQGPNQDSDDWMNAVRAQVRDIRLVKLPDARRKLQSGMLDIAYLAVGWVVAGVCAILAASLTGISAALAVGADILAVPVITLTKIVHKNLTLQENPQSKEILLLTAPDRVKLIVDIAREEAPKEAKRVFSKSVSLLLKLYDISELFGAAKMTNDARDEINKLQQTLDELLAEIPDMAGDRKAWASIHAAQATAAAKQLQLVGNAILKCQSHRPVLRE